ncbi:MAG: MFS transporter [Lapillicoccus sp.]
MSTPDPAARDGVEGVSGDRDGRLARLGDDPAHRRRRRALHLGGLLGPFGGGLTAVMLPELSADFGVGITAAGWALTAYFVPFAALQLVSGTLGERWGRRRTTQIAFVVYAMASLLCAVAPTAGIFFSGRVIQGAANAFTTPLLVTGLAELVPAARLSKTLGVFAACQAAGQSLAPLVGGLANAASWRYAFVLVALVSAALAFVPPEGGRSTATTRPRYADLVTGRMALICAAGFSSYAGVAGLPFLVSLYSERRLGVSATVVGVVLLGFGVAGILLASTWGGLSERYGAATASATGLVASGAAVALMGQTRTLAEALVVWTVAGAVSALATVGIQNLAAREVPGNRAGAVSVVSAFRFSGGAVAPLLWLPLYPDLHRQGVPQAGLAFVLAGILAVLGGVCAAALRGVRPVVRPGAPRPTPSGPCPPE